MGGRWGLETGEADPERLHTGGRPEGRFVSCHRWSSVCMGVRDVVGWWVGGRAMPEPMQGMCVSM